MNIELSTLLTLTDDLRVPDEELLNIKILNAAKQGVEYGQNHPDREVVLNQRIRLCRSIIRRFECTPLDACMILELPKAEREHLLKILKAQDRQKPIAKEK